jgi:hypothetical protein
MTAQSLCLHALGLEPIYRNRHSRRAMQVLFQGGGSGSAHSQEQAAPKPSAVLAVYTKAGGGLSKKISLVDGKPFADSTQCWMSKGAAINTPVNSARELADLVENMKPNQALSLGRITQGIGAQAVPQEVLCVSKKNLDQKDPRVICRTQEYVGYVTGQPGWMVLDFDQKGMPDSVKELLGGGDRLGAVWNAIVKACPGLAGAACVTRFSTSSGLSNATTGEKYPSSGGLHIYVRLADAADIPRALKALCDRLWLAGLGWIWLGATGQMLLRSIVDASCDGPERLVFEGAPVVEFPLVQDAASRRPSSFEGATIDTQVALPDLNPVEQTALARVLAVARNAARPEADKTAEKADKETAERIFKKAKTGKTFEEILEQIKLRREGILMPCHELEFDDPEIGVVTVADVMKAPEKYIGETLADPREGVAYGRCKGMVMGAAGDYGGMVIHSFAHGRALYQLKMDFEMVKAIVTAHGRSGVLKLYFRLREQAEFDVEQEAEMKKIVINLSGLGARVFKAAEKEFKQKKAKAQQKEKVSDDPRPAIEAPSRTDPLNEPILMLDMILSSVANPIGAPFLNIEGRHARVEMRSLPGLHQLVSEAEQAKAGDGFIPAPPQHSIAEIDAAQMALTYEKFVRMWVRRANPVTGEEYEAEVRLPQDMAMAYAGWDKSALARVSGVSPLPIVLPVGEILATNGLHRKYGAIFDVDPSLLECLPKGKTTLVQAQAAYKYLTDTWLVDVATDDWGKASLVSLAATLIERLLLPERPAWIVTAALRGNGKTTTLHMINMAIYGVLAAAAGWSLSEEERKKQLFAFALAGAAFVVFDNLPRGTVIKSAAFDAAATGCKAEDRVLGESRIGHAVAATVYAVTGNIISAHGDTASRTMYVGFSTDDPHPEARAFTHPDPAAWTMSHRKQILTALYSILMLDRKEPGANACRFKTWWKLVGDPVSQAAGVDLSMAAIDNEAEDEEITSHVQLSHLLQSKLGFKAVVGFTVRDVAELLKPCESQFAPGHAEALEIKALIEGAAGKAFPTGFISTKILGNRLSVLVGRPVPDGDVIIKWMSERNRANQMEYRITTLQP